MIATKPWTGGTDEEYEAQHFGFGVQRLQIAVRQMVEHRISTGVKDMEAHLQNTLNSNETDKTILTHFCDKLIRLYCERAEPCLQIIDKEIERIIKIPPHVLLPGDEVQLNQVTDEEYQKLKEEVANLRKRVERGAMMEALLTCEEEEIASIEQVCETAKKDMEVLDVLHKNIEGHERLTNINNETDFLCASVPFMKQIESESPQPFPI
ncbi:hypothetical protein NE865_09255 [Phthorimaea operculella]|nr:hypothetical protein NE865_09255 [Phthorimaea operculella]